MKSSGSPAPVACVIDGNPALAEQLLRWFACLHVLAEVPAAGMLVCAVDGARPAALEYLQAVGVSVLDVARFDARSLHCNKISGLREIAARADALDGVAVLADCDLAFLRDPRTCGVADDAIAAKTVDGPNPPVEVLGAILDAAGLPHPPIVALELFPEARTFAGYCNGGLYAGRMNVLHGLCKPWDRWARWVLERRDMLKHWPEYVDQVAMLLALAETGVAFHPLDARWNCPTHLPAPLPVTEVFAVHYHWKTDALGHLNPTGNRAVDEAACRIDAAFDDVRRDAGVLRCA